MSDNKFRLRNVLRMWAAEFERRKSTLQAEIVETQVAGMPFAVRVKQQNGASFIVYNYTAQSAKGARVEIGMDERGGRYVTRPLFYPGEQAPEGFNVQNHWKTHTRGGTDEVWLDSRQIMNGLVLPVGDFKVKVYASLLINAAGQAIRLQSKTLDLAAHKPTTSGKWKYVLLAADESGQPGVIDGAETDFLGLTLAKLPAIPSGHYGLCWVRLHEGQERIADRYADSDFVDPRFALRTGKGELHAGTHQTGGDDEIDVTGLSGKLADPQIAGWLRGYEIDGAAPTSGNVLGWNSGASVWKPHALKLNELADTNYGIATDGQVLTYSAASDSWVAADPAGGGGGGVSLTDAQKAIMNISLAGTLR